MYGRDPGIVASIAHRHRRREAADVAAEIWDVIARMEVSTSGTRIVAGSKALHHVLPDLVPPIDRRYTFRFFTRQTDPLGGGKTAFLEWLPYFCEIGRARRDTITATVVDGGFMATGPAKVIDNAIMGFMQPAIADVEPGVDRTTQMR